MVMMVMAMVDISVHLLPNHDHLSMCSGWSWGHDGAGYGVPAMSHWSAEWWELLLLLLLLDDDDTPGSFHPWVRERERGKGANNALQTNSFYYIINIRSFVPFLLCKVPSPLSPLLSFFLFGQIWVYNTIWINHALYIEREVACFIDGQEEQVRAWPWGWRWRWHAHSMSPPLFHIVPLILSGDGSEATTRVASHRKWKEGASNSFIPNRCVHLPSQLPNRCVQFLWCISSGSTWSSYC